MIAPLILTVALATPLNEAKKLIDLAECYCKSKGGVIVLKIHRYGGWKYYGEYTCATSMEVDVYIEPEYVCKE